MPDYQPLVRDYCTELRVARDHAQSWWEGLLAREQQQHGDPGDRDAAIKRLRVRWVVGPVAHPRVIAVFRKYHALVEALNEQHELVSRNKRVDARDESAWGDVAAAVDDESITLEPNALLLENLSAADESLGEFMRAFLFIPIADTLTQRAVQ